MSCNCSNIPASGESTFVSRLGGSIVESSVPLSNGLRIPQQGVFRGYKDYYTVCKYLPSGQIPDIPSFIQLSKTSDTLNYYEETIRLGVLSYPTSELSFPDDFRVVSDTLGEWRVYPNESDDFYVLVQHIIDKESPDIVEQHFDITLVGYESDDSTAFQLPITVQAGDKSTDFTVTLYNPYLKVSSDYVILSQEEGSHDSVNLVSNVHWWLDL